MKINSSCSEFCSFSKRVRPKVLNLDSFGVTVNPRLNAAVLIQNSTFLTRRLFEGGAYSNKTQRFQMNDYFSVKELIFLHPPRSYPPSSSESSS